jgi:hypothetical protein
MAIYPSSDAVTDMVATAALTSRRAHRSYSVASAGISVA